MTAAHACAPAIEPRDEVGERRSLIHVLGPDGRHLWPYLAAAPLWAWCLPHLVGEAIGQIVDLDGDHREVMAAMRDVTVTAGGGRG